MESCPLLRKSGTEALDLDLENGSWKLEVGVFVVVIAKPIGVVCFGSRVEMESCHLRRKNGTEALDLDLDFASWLSFVVDGSS